ncbi:MAG: glycosyltransferase [Deltaproteobacteria bacterium]|nr:glycosyltransferase [Deltaproteobacteria bacterium]
MPECDSVGSDAMVAGAGGVTIHRLPGRFGPRALVELSRILKRRPGERLLVQYVPHSFGFKAMNLPFCLWLYAHTRKYGGATVMFHEVELGILPGDPMRYRLIDAANTLMARLVVRSAAQIFIAALTWKTILRRYNTEGRPITWLPMPSTIAVVDDKARIAAAKLHMVPGGGPVVGHFGTFAPAIAAMLDAIVPQVLAHDSTVTMVLIGANSDTFREALLRENPALAGRIRATGALQAEDVSLTISSCDVMMQPYPDGVSSRRTSMMAALEHTRATVTTAGPFTEPLWQQSDAVSMVRTGDANAFAAAVVALVGNPTLRERYANAAKALFASHFDLSHTIEVLRTSACG